MGEGRVGAAGGGREPAAERRERRRRDERVRSAGVTPDPGDGAGKRPVDVGRQSRKLRGTGSDRVGASSSASPAIRLSRRRASGMSDGGGGKAASGRWDRPP